MLGRRLARASMIEEMPQSQQLQTRNIFGKNVYKARETKLISELCGFFFLLWHSKKLSKPELVWGLNYRLPEACGS